MNKNKNSKIMLVLSILLLFLIIGSVSATDETSNETVSTTTNDGVDTISHEGDNVDEKASFADNLGSSDANNTDSKLESSNNELLSENSVNWTVLENELKGDTVTLNHKYYKYTQGDNSQFNLTGIKVLDGNGATIDADNKTDVYPFRSNGNITIKNINFINVVSSTVEVENSYIGGPIHFSVGSSNVIFDNCNFTKLTSTQNGIAGAIGLPQSHNITIKNCNFYNNKVYNTLIIFYNSGFTNENITISDCKFDNINSTNFNGILWAYSLRNFTLKNCEFTNNKPVKELIYAGSFYNCTIDKCIFNNNTMKHWVLRFNHMYNSTISNSLLNGTRGIGGTIHNVNITYCNFTNILVPNIDKTDNAVVLDTGSGSNDYNVVGCNIINVTAGIANGGAVVAAGVRGTFSECNFVNCSTGTSGGAINFNRGPSYMKVLYSNFTDCYSGLNGGAIEFYAPHSIVDHCIFKGNHVTSALPRDNPNKPRTDGNSGGAIVIFSNAMNQTVTFCEFYNNWVVDGNNTVCDGGAIGVTTRNNKNITIMNCTFVGNNASDGGAVSFNSDNSFIINSTFINNTATRSGGAIYVNAKNSQIDSSEFINNTAPSGKDSYASPKGEVVYKGLYFDEFYIKNDDNQETDVGKGNGGSADNPVRWLNNLYEYFKADSVITLYIVGSLDNFTTKILTEKYSNVVIKALNSTSGFKNLGHTVFNIKTDHVTLDGLNFQNITDHVIRVNDDGTTIKNCVFTGNNASGNGSCILLESKGSNLRIENCTFNENNVTENGGAIYIKNTTDSSQIIKCKFTNNHAGQAGGAIYIGDGIFYHIVEPVYSGNTANKHDNASTEGAMEMMSTVYVTNDTTAIGRHVGDRDHPMYIGMAFNAIAPNGVIIFANKGDIVYHGGYTTRELAKSNVTFIGNDTIFVDVGFIAGVYASNIKLYNLTFTNYTGVAINCLSADNIIQDCKFINCTKGCIIVTGDGSKAVNCTFENNTLDGNGTCIMIDAKSITIENSTFTGNNATENGGAIYITKDASDINLVNSEFNDNNATLGGAVYNNGALTIKESSRFTANNATLGGAVYNNATLTINDSQFTNNNATYGGAVFSNAKVTIMGTGFTGNSAVYGGALFLNASDNTLDALSFNDNSALYGSAIYINQTGTLTLKGTDFTSNRVSDEGEGTVYFAQNNTLTAEDLTFKNNVVGSSGLNIFAADGAILFSKVLYVSPDGNGQGIVSGERTTLSNALKQVVKDSIIYLEQGTYDIDTLRFINQQVTIMGNGSTIRTSKDKSLFNNRLTSIKSCS